MRIALTGGAGVIGRAVTQRLVREPDVIVRAVARHGWTSPSTVPDELRRMAAAQAGP